MNKGRYTNNLLLYLPLNYYKMFIALYDLHRAIPNAKLSLFSTQFIFAGRM